MSQSVNTRKLYQNPTLSRHCSAETISRQCRDRNPTLSRHCSVETVSRQCRDRWVLVVVSHRNDPELLQKKDCGAMMDGQRSVKKLAGGDGKRPMMSTRRRRGRQCQ